MSEALVSVDHEGSVYFVVSPNNGPGYRVYLEDDLQAVGGVHAVERALESESYWFFYLGRVRGRLGESGVGFHDSDLALLAEPPDHTWKIGRCNPAFGRTDLERSVFRTQDRGPIC